jgi:hypothetical protein
LYDQYRPLVAVVSVKPQAHHGELHLILIFPFSPRG